MIHVFCKQSKTTKLSQTKKQLADARLVVYNIQIFSFWGHFCYLQKKV